METIIQILTNTTSTCIKGTNKTYYTLSTLLFIRMFSKDNYEHLFKMLAVYVFFALEINCLSSNVKISTGCEIPCKAIANNNAHDYYTHGIVTSRRSYLTSASAAFIGGINILVGNQVSYAEDTLTSNDNRNNLLRLINDKKSIEDEILNAIDNIIPYDPSNSNGAILVDDLDGEWKLLWSAKAESFSPLLKLPFPLKPMSYQYLGQASASEVGSDRVAQGLTGGVLGSNQLWLSSGVRPSTDDKSILEILPPFRLEIGGRYQSGKAKKTLVNSESDADFRKLNARNEEEQGAPKNSYKQLYLERNGRGSLRISKIISGDPVIVGAIFIHEKL